MTILCFDISSGGFSAALFDSKLKVLGLHEARWEIALDKSGEATLPLDAITARLKEVLRDFDIPKRIDAICIGAFMHNCVVLDAANKPLTPVFTWLDRRGEAGLEYIRSRMADTFHQRTGCHFHPMFPVFKLATLYVNDSVLQRAKRIVSVKEFLIQRLTGVWIEDHGMASASGLYNVIEGDWDEKILELIGLDRDVLPLVAGLDEVVGRITPAAAVEFGLRGETVVINGSGDGFLAHIGSGCETPGKISVSLGTSAVARETLHEPILDPHAGTFCYRANSAQYMLGCASSNGGNVLDWGRSIFGEFAEPPAAGDDPPIFLPLLHGERSPDWNPKMTGSWHGLTSQHTSAHLSRSILEGVIFNLGYLVEILQTASSVDASEIVLSGNGFLNPLAGPLLAAITGIPVSMPPDPGLASLRGAALCAFRALDSPVPALKRNPVPPVNDLRVIPRFEKYKRLRNRMKNDK